MVEDLKACMIVLYLVEKVSITVQVQYKVQYLYLYIHTCMCSSFFYDIVLDISTPSQNYLYGMYLKIHPVATVVTKLYCHYNNHPYSNHPHNSHSLSYSSILFNPKLPIACSATVFY